jgi:hypothetical protein
MYLIYHPKRCIHQANGITIHHDKFGEKNEDPYIFNDRFLHSFCHITQIKAEAGNINFWVSGDKFPDFNHLYCDCVFVIQEKVFWENANQISISDIVVDNQQSYQHHYRWGNSEHRFNKKRRFTLKGHPGKSFQPQNADGTLIDILPFLESIGYSLLQLRRGLRAGFNSKPMKIDFEQGIKIYDFLFAEAAIKLFGKQLKDLHP